MGFEERFGGFGRGRVGGLMGMELKQEPGRGRGKVKGWVKGKGCSSLEVCDGIWIRVLGGGGVMSRGDIGDYA